LDVEWRSRKLTFLRKGGKVVAFPLAPRTARAVERVPASVERRSQVEGDPELVAGIPEKWRFGRHPDACLANRRRSQRLRSQVVDPPAQP